MIVSMETADSRQCKIYFFRILLCKFFILPISIYIYYLIKMIQISYIKFLLPSNR